MGSKENSGLEEQQVEGTNRGEIKDTCEEKAKGAEGNEDEIEDKEQRGRGRPKKQAATETESEANEMKDVDNGTKRIRRKGKNDGNKMDEEVLGNGSEDLVSPLRVPGEGEEAVPDSKRKRDVSWKTIAKEDRLTCHQCKRNDKGRVVRCKLCNVKRYCIPCITNWYPKMSED